jgi:DNA-binding CsgD family transcriptional regulator/streptogramin lyase
MGFWGVGMRCYNPETKKLTYYNSTEKGPYQLEGLHVWDFEEDQAGNFWVASLGAGLVRFSKNGSEREVFFKSSATSQLKILDLMCDSKGTLWVAFEDNGIAYKGNNDLTFTHIDNKETGLNSKYTQCLFEDSKGNIWVGTKSQGINLFVNGHFKALTMKEGLIANDIQSIFEDNNGHIWASSTKGFSRITLRDGETTGIITIESPDENPITHRTSCKDSDGHLYVGGLKGLNKIEILYDEQSHTPPKALIANIRTKFDILENHNYELLYQIISNNGIIELPKGDQDIIIDFACPDMSDTHMVQYQYQFSEQGEQWKTLYNGDRHVVFTNLGGGTYTLKFRCKTGFSDWGETNQIQIKISVPFYRSPVFLVILGLIILLLSIFILLLRNYSRLANTKRKLLEAETQRLKNTASDLAEQVNVKDSQIMAKSAEMALKTEKLTGMLDSIGSHKDPTNTTQALRSIANKMHAELKSDEEWDTFKIYFDKANQNFTKKLLQQYPQLTANDIRICMLIRLKMSTKEIAQMLNITVMGVQKNRYRMKKRMHLDEAEDLQSFLLNFKVDEEPKNLNNGV